MFHLKEEKDFLFLYNLFMIHLKINTKSQLQNRRFYYFKPLWLFHYRFIYITTTNNFRAIIFSRN